MCIYIYIYIHIHIPMCVYTYIYIYIHWGRRTGAHANPVRDVYGYRSSYYLTAHRP